MGSLKAEVVDENTLRTILGSDLVSVPNLVVVGPVVFAKNATDKQTNRFPTNQNLLDLTTGTNANPGYSQRKGMYNDDTKAGIVLPWQFLLKVELDLVIRIKFCSDLKLDLNHKGMIIMKIHWFLVLLSALAVQNKFVID